MADLGTSSAEMAASWYSSATGSVNVGRRCCDEDAEDAALLEAEVSWAEGTSLSPLLLAAACVAVVVSSLDVVDIPVTATAPGWVADPVVAPEEKERFESVSPDCDDLVILSSEGMDAVVPFTAEAWSGA